MPDRLVNQRSGDSRVDATAQSADRPGRADLSRDCSDLGVDDRAHRPRRGAPARSWRKRCSTTMPCGECTTSGWNFTPQILRERALQGRHRGVGRRRRGDEPIGDPGDGVEVAHPHVVCRGEVVKQCRWSVGNFQLGPAVLAAKATTDLAAELLGDRAGRRSRCPGSARRARRSRGSSRGAPSTWTLLGPPDRIGRPAGRRRARRL